MLSALRGDEVAAVQYQAPPSGGKTATVAPLAVALAEERRQNAAARGRYLVYACFSSNVRTDVCKHLVAASVPFAILHKGLAQLSTSCYSNARGHALQRFIPERIDHMQALTLPERIDHSLRVMEQPAVNAPCVLVCDMSEAAAWLAERQQDVLVFDEPDAGGETLRLATRQVFAVLPRITVFMSATLGYGDTWAEVLEKVQRRHGARQPECYVELSAETRASLMSRTAVDLAGRIWRPDMFGHSADASSGTTICIASTARGWRCSSFARSRPGPGLSEIIFAPSMKDPWSLC